jgi:integral membrane protein
MNINALSILRIVAWIEGITYLLLGITMPLKYVYEMPEPNLVVGMAHGVFFIWYVMQVFGLAIADKWSKTNTILALAASLIPFGTFVAEKKLFRYR